MNYTGCGFIEELALWHVNSIIAIFYIRKLFSEHSLNAAIIIVIIIIIIVIIIAMVVYWLTASDSFVSYRI